MADYRIKYSFYHNGQYSGEAGRVVDEDFFKTYAGLGYADNMEGSGLKPAASKSDEEIDKDLAELLEEKERRATEAAKTISTKVSQETNPEEGQEDASKSSKKATK